MKRNKGHIIASALFLFFIFHFSFSQAQASRHQLRQGNRDYNKQRYERAEVNYRKALERDSTDFRGQYNLAGDLYRQEKYGEAASHYQQALSAQGISDKQRARTLHNQGNSLLKGAMQSEQMEGLQQAINCYQEALKLNPKNDDTRYNLAYARRLLQQQQQQQQDKQQQQRQPQPQQDQRKQDAERMLDAVKNNERQALRDKEQSNKPVRVRRNEKDW